MSELFKLKNGTVLVSTEAPGGIYNSAQLKKIADLCSKDLAIVKATEDQRLALFVKEDELDRVISELKATGLGFRNYQEGLHQPVSCLGELCESHEQPALTTAMDLTKLIAEMNLSSPLKIGINGCARCCTPCHTLDISVIGEASGYRVSLGGKTSQFPELASFFAEAVPAKDLPRLLATVVELFKVKAEPGETFNEVLDRVGSEDFVAALAPYSQDAAHRDDPFATPEATDEAAESAMSDESEELSLDDENALEIEAPETFGEVRESDEMVIDEPVEEELFTDSAPADESADEEMTFDFSRDDESPGELSEVRIDENDEPVLPGDILVNGGEEPAIEDDVDLIFEDESLMSEDLAASEPELIEDESFELEADVPQLAEETSEMPELGEELLENTEMSPGVVTDTSILDDGDEGDSMDTEAERLFEEKLQASIDEDKKMRDETDIDENVDARADALRLLENANDIDTDAESLELSDDEETLLVMSDDMDDSDLEDVSELEIEESPAMTQAPKPVMRSITPSQDYDFEGFDLIDHALRVSFGSGAYLDFQLDVLPPGKSRVFRAGGATIRVTHEEGGFSVEGGGMKMFYPHAAMRAAS